MSTQRTQCIAMTKSGDQCRNRAVEGSHYCAIHARTAVSAEAGTLGVLAAESASSAGNERLRVENMAREFNRIAEDVKRTDPKYTPPPFSPEALRKVLKANLDTLAAYMPIDLARDIVRNLEGTQPKDLLDLDTWKGLWFILHYTAQGQAKELGEGLLKRVNAVPGMDMVTMLGQSVYESPRDLLDVDTWKGAAVVLNAAVKANLSGLRRRLLGGTDE